MQRILHSNWQFHFISTLAKGKFFIHPNEALSMGSQVAKILNRDWDNMATTDLDKERNRAEFPVAAVSHDKDAFGNFDQAPKGSTALIPLKGSMLKYGTWCSYGTEEVAAAIYAAAVHRNISSIVIDIDSGGGSVDSVAPVEQAIKFARKNGKPVVASVDMACSAAYWAASACNSIIADNNISATVGSIGVMMSFWDVKGYYEAQGFKLHTILAPGSNDKNKAFLLGMEEKYEIIQIKEQSPLAINFQNTIKTNRAGKINLAYPGILNGITLYAPKALSEGMIDEIGDRETAVQRAQELATVNEFLKS